MYLKYIACISWHTTSFFLFSSKTWHKLKRVLEPTVVLTKCTRDARLIQFPDLYSTLYYAMSTYGANSWIMSKPHDASNVANYNGLSVSLRFKIQINHNLRFFLTWFTIYETLFTSFTIYNTFFIYFTIQIYTVFLPSLPSTHNAFYAIQLMSFIRRIIV